MPRSGEGRTTTVMQEQTQSSSAAGDQRIADGTLGRQSATSHATGPVWCEVVTQGARGGAGADTSSPNGCITGGPTSASDGDLAPAPRPYHHHMRRSSLLLRSRWSSHRQIPRGRRFRFPHDILWFFGIARSGVESDKAEANATKSTLMKATRAAAAPIAVLPGVQQVPGRAYGPASKQGRRF